MSSKTPKATAKPSSARNTNGKTPRTAKVAAKTIPAEVITPPVTVKPLITPFRVPQKNVTKEISDNFRNKVHALRDVVMTMNSLGHDNMIKDMKAKMFAVNTGLNDEYNIILILI